MDEVFKKAALAFGKNEGKRERQSRLSELRNSLPEYDLDDFKEKIVKPPRKKLIWQVRAENRRKNN
jgi:hypothetical protein